VTGAPKVDLRREPPIDLYLRLLVHVSIACSFAAEPHALILAKPTMAALTTINA
jgi:hypothetical protein